MNAVHTAAKYRPEIRWIHDLGDDVRYAIRLALKTPRYTIAVALTLTLGIGASSAVFSVVNAVLVKPLPYPDPDRIVLLGNRSRAGVVPGVSVPRFEVWRAATTLFQEPAAYVFRGFVNLRRDGDVEQVIAGRVSVNFFPLFGASLTAGRTFHEDEDRPTGPHVVVLGHAIWRSRFGAARNVVGTNITVNDVPHTVIGVLSGDFDPRSATPFVGRAPDIWIPLQLDPSNRSDANNLFVAARLRAGATLAQAEADTDRATAVFRQTLPGVMPPTMSLAIVPLQQMVTSGVRDALQLLLASVAFLLLLVCANLACLALVRTYGRSEEWTVRAAIGATRGRVVRQLLTENIVVAIPGSVLGVWLGIAGIRALLTIQPGSIPRIAQDGTGIALDWRVLIFAVVASLFSAVLFGLGPALLVSRADLHSQLKASGGRSGSRAGHGRLRALLVVGEVALASILLVGAALLTRSFDSVRRTDPGFDSHGVVTMNMIATGPRIDTTDAFAQTVHAGEASLAAQPGVMSVGATLTGAPLEGDNSLLNIEVVGRAPANGIVGSWRVITPGYFRVFTIPLIRGRLFTDADAAASEPVAIVNRSLAARFWPGGDSLNDQLLLGNGAGPDFADVPRRIIGVVGDTRQAGLDKPPLPAVYVPVAQLPDAETAFFNRLNVPTTWFVRTWDSSSQLPLRLRRTLQGATAAAVTQPRAMDDVLAISMRQRTFETLVMTMFAGAALLLSAVGVFGVCAYSVQQRTQEIGIRLSLGAPARLVRAMVFKEGLTLASAGLAVGLLTAFFAVGALRTLLYGVTPHDAIAFGSAALLLLAVVLLAVWLPAERAARVDPYAALRSE